MMDIQSPLKRVKKLQERMEHIENEIKILEDRKQLIFLECCLLLDSINGGEVIDARKVGSIP